MRPQEHSLKWQLGVGPTSAKLNGTINPKGSAAKYVLTQPASQANIGRVSVALPPTEFANPCTRPQFAERQVPAELCLGKVTTAYTLLLDKPLSGKVYRPRSNGLAVCVAKSLTDIRMFRYVI